MIPEIGVFVQLSELYHVTIDRLINEDEYYIVILGQTQIAIDSAVDLQIKAKKNAYAAHATEVETCRPKSHDLAYESGDYKYYDFFRRTAVLRGRSHLA